MPTGTVATWNAKGRYGFAMSTTGQAVFIHSQDLVGAGENLRLAVGQTVNFTTEQVAGHDGRVRGKNVTGAGVMSWDEWKEFAESGDGGAAAREAKEAWSSHKEGAGWTGEKRQPRGVGGGRPAGGRVAGGVQKRIDPADGNPYTMQQFKEEYGGLKEWNRAKPYGSGRGRGAR
eukprot:TRINITY_DN2473_c0_g1_i2.p1 TRINITY_DN2473_c0_g1~~TRINITY_DN2473_c0_g1_i2.p1  ORF type:complete len:174 (+),score=33.34 TRINITY_DN2473_c0_g1_i2:113-634(+)